jgi:hypothetical protein
MHISTRKLERRPSPACREDQATRVTAFTGAMVRLVGVCRPAYGKATKAETVHYLQQ